MIIIDTVKRIKKKKIPDFWEIFINYIILHSTTKMLNFNFEIIN